MSCESFERRNVVTAFLRNQGKFLIVRRSAEVGTYRGRWSGISGYMEHSPHAQALQEIAEETGLSETEVRLVAEGVPLEVPDEELRVCWVIHPFLFDVQTPQHIRLDWENIESRWVEASELKRYATVPALAEALNRCLSPDI